jgi:hypothetical protein
VSSIHPERITDILQVRKIIIHKILQDVSVVRYNIVEVSLKKETKLDTRPRLRWLVISSRHNGLALIPDQFVGFVVDKVALGQVSAKYFGFP